MENKEIIEGNKLIAEFMGGKYRKGNKKQSIEERYFGLIEKGYYHWVSELRYHKSWDWIMPVVEKIERMDGELFTVIITNDLCKITQFVNTNSDLLLCDEDIITSKLTDSKIKSVYDSVVEFIKWYNENKDNGK